ASQYASWATRRGFPDSAPGGHIISGFINGGYVSVPSFPDQSKSISTTRCLTGSHITLFSRRSPWTREAAAK
ncbi:TPA: hypothetical protein N0F65_003091, partial [Lagenidium giganteum]